MTTPKPKKQSEHEDMQLPPKPSVEEKVDEGVKETFPASDPVSVAARPDKVRTEQPPHREKRSPDWLLEKR